MKKRKYFIEIVLGNRSWVGKIADLNEDELKFTKELLKKLTTGKITKFSLDLQNGEILYISDYNLKRAVFILNHIDE